MRFGDDDDIELNWVAAAFIVLIALWLVVIAVAYRV
jgi:hypothetical protein